MVIFYNFSVSLKLCNKVFWIQDTTNSLQPKKDKWTHYVKKNKMIVGHAEK